MRRGCTSPAFLGAQRKCPKKLTILSLKTQGDRFYQPLQMGLQNIPARGVPANFSILACTMVRTL